MKLKTQTDDNKKLIQDVIYTSTSMGTASGVGFNMGAA